MKVLPSSYKCNLLIFHLFLLLMFLALCQNCDVGHVISLMGSSWFDDDSFEVSWFSVLKVFFLFRKTALFEVRLLLIRNTMVVTCFFMYTGVALIYTHSRLLLKLLQVQSNINLAFFVSIFLSQLLQNVSLRLRLPKLFLLKLLYFHLSISNTKTFCKMWNSKMVPQKQHFTYNFSLHDSSSVSVFSKLYPWVQACMVCNPLYINIASVIFFSIFAQGQRYQAQNRQGNLLCKIFRKTAQEKLFPNSVVNGHTPDCHPLFKVI